MLNPHVVREAFDSVAERYDRHAALEQEVARRLLERCEFARRDPQRILDLGCGTGQACAALKKKFRKAQVVGLDSAFAMLVQARRRSSFLRPFSRICTDLSALPCANGTIDLLFCNLAIHWSADTAALFSEFRRVLKPGGMLLFSTLGPATLREMGGSESPASDQHSPALGDLMVVGDALVAAGFREPVMDMEIITVRYRSTEVLRRELESTGMSLLVPGWENWPERLQNLESDAGDLASGDAYRLSYEIIYGTAFGPEEGQPVRTSEGDVATFSVEGLLKSRRLR